MSPRSQEFGIPTVFSAVFSVYSTTIPQTQQLVPTRKVVSEPKQHYRIRACKSFYFLKLQPTLDMLTFNATNQKTTKL